MTNDQKTSGLNMFLIVALFGMVVALWLLFGKLIICTNLISANEIGDAYGSLNTLFSGLAFAGMIVAIFLQKNELKAQREELALTRKEFAELAETANLQRFEHSFYNMLSGFQNLVSGLTTGVPPKAWSGVSAITRISSYLWDDIWENLGAKITEYQVSNEPSLSYLKSNLISITEDYLVRLTVSHYFNFLYRLLLFIDESPSFKPGQDSYKSKQQYVATVRACLSQSEYRAIFFVALGMPSLKALIEKYSFFADFNTDVFNRDGFYMKDLLLFDLYDKAAFRTND